MTGGAAAGRGIARFWRIAAASAILGCACVLALASCDDDADKAKTERYEGERRDGVAHGRGVLTFGDGDRYTGEFRDGAFHGCGTYARANGEYYIGEFRDDEFHGVGSYGWPGGALKTCEWRDGRPVERTCVTWSKHGSRPDAVDRMYEDGPCG